MLTKVTTSGIITTLMALAITLPLVGCGDNSNNDNIFIGNTPTPKRTSTSSQVTPTVVIATATPAESTPVVTATPETGPTATPTPSGNACEAGDQIVVMASVGKPYGGISFRLAYPPAANIPGNGTAQSVKDRVVFAHVGGIQVANDLDNNADGVDDTLSAGTVNTSESPAGLFITATFDCFAGQARPAASDFSCQVQSASTPDGIDIPDETCSLSVQ